MLHRFPTAFPTAFTTATGLLGGALLTGVLGCSGGPEESAPSAADSEGTSNDPASSASGATPDEVPMDDAQDLIAQPEVASGVGAECARDEYQGERAAVNLYLLLDISGSMLAPVAVDSELTQWDAVRTAVTGFIEAGESAGFNLALNYFPILSDRTDCDDLNRCPGSVSCITRICDLRYLAYGEIASCALDVNCGLTFQVEESTYVEACVQPGRCSDDEFLLCYIDEECGPGSACLAPSAGLCPGENSCDPARYEDPSVALTTLPDASGQLVESLLTHEPDAFGKTPTQVALQGAYVRVSEWLESEPATRSVVVLATDGAPYGCQGDIPDDEAVVQSTLDTFDAIEAAEGDGLDTFVIGVVPDLSGLEPDDQAELGPVIQELEDQLSRMAELGGTESSFNVTANDTTTDAFSEALAAIRGQVLPCDYQIPEPEVGSVTFTQLNVELTDGGETRVVPKVDTLADCVSGEDAWYYNVDEETQTPTRVVLCPDTCSSVSQAVSNRVDIVLGCNTIESAR